MPNSFRVYERKPAQAGFFDLACVLKATALLFEIDFFTERQVLISDSGLFDGMVVFVRTVESGSFSKAAELLGHSPSHISKLVAKLEDKLGVRLLNRSTRNLHLTTAGRQYFEKCQLIVQDAINAQESLTALQQSPKGLLKVTAPVSLGTSYLNEIFVQYLLKYPDVDLHVDYNQRKVDVVAEGFDVAIRVGELTDSNLIAKRIATTSGVTVAAPSYLNAYGQPRDISELSQHRVISYSNMGPPKYWELTDRKGKKHSTRVNPRLVCNDAELEVAVASAGIAIVRLPLVLCQHAIAQGKLMRIMTAYEQPDFGIYAVYPHRQLISAKVDSFIQFVSEQFPRLSE